MNATRGPVVAFGPEAPGWGSWDWVGADIAAQLQGPFQTEIFRPWDVPDADLVVVVKHEPPPEWIHQVRSRCPIVYCPVDRYGSAAEIDGDAAWLRRCARILVHCERLRRYFEPYAPVDYIDHHVKFAAPLRDRFDPSGPILWVGVHTNLPPLVQWINAHSLPRPLDVLSNFEGDGPPPDPVDLGFVGKVEVRTHRWSPEAQVEFTTRAAGVLDLKGHDFRARHKPPAKGIDAIASGVPLAMNLDSSTVEHLARMGFEVCSPEDPTRWLSRAYAQETQRFGAALRELFSLPRIANRYTRFLTDLLSGPGRRHAEDR